MERPVFPIRIYRFGPFELATDVLELRKRGVRLKLQDQPFQILCALLEHHGDRDVLHVERQSEAEQQNEDQRQNDADRDTGRVANHLPRFLPNERRDAPEFRAIQ